MLAAEIFKTVVESTPLVSIDLCLVSDSKLLMGLRENEPLKGRWFTPGGRLLKNERWQDGLVRIAKTELGLDVSSDHFKLMGVWDHFYSNSAVGEEISTHYVNLPHVSYLKNEPALSLDTQHNSVRWFELTSIVNDATHQDYVVEYANWILNKTDRGRFL